MTERDEKEQKLRDEMSRCMLLSDEDKKFWIDHASTLPNSVLEKVIAIVMEKNTTVDQYLNAALAQDPDHLFLAELKSKIKKIKETAFSMTEETEKESAEELLKKHLENL